MQRGHLAESGWAVNGTFPLIALLDAGSCDFAHPASTNREAVPGRQPPRWACC